MERNRLAHENLTSQSTQRTAAEAAEEFGVFSVAVVVVLFGLRDRDHATVRDFAVDVLELDGGVVDAEVVEQALFYVAQDALADRRRNVGDRDVAGEGVRF